MSDRYFKNSYPDYNGEQYLGSDNQVCHFIHVFFIDQYFIGFS